MSTDADASEPIGPDKPRRVPDARVLVLMAGGFLALGLLWRSVRYFLQFPIWGDEGLVLFDVLDCDYYSLTQTLPIFQIAPILFLWAERAVWQLFGGSELAVRLPAFLAGCGGLCMVAWTARRFLTPLQGMFAIALLAVSYWPVRHGCEVKPYALDLFVAATLLHGAVAWLHEPRRIGWLIFLSLFTPAAILASYPAAFVAGGLSLAMLPKVWSAGWKALGLYALFNVLMLAAFIGHYFGVTRNQIAGPQLAEQSAWLQDYWHDAFPPPSLTGWPLWLAKVHAGSIFALPVGGSAWVGSLSLLLAVLGAAGLWTSGRRSLLLACAAPFALSLLAAALHKYPYGGSPRLAQHLAPMACVLIGTGAATALSWRRSPVARARAILAACTVLAVLGISGMVRDVWRPTKAQHELAIRSLVAEFRNIRAEHEPVLLCNRFGEAPIVAEWYLRMQLDDCHRVDVLDGMSQTAWLIWFTQDSAGRLTAEQVLSLIDERARDWAVADSVETWVPPGGPGDPGYYCMRVRIVHRP
jgi:hypothetical protein